MVADPDLPPALLELALERLYSVPPEAREQAATELATAHPQHGIAVRELFARMSAVERTLELSFPEPVDDPETIEGLKVIQRLGEGAFGVVYLCEQTSPVVRRVAVKVLRPGVGDRDVLRRFRAEQQLLAMLTHPAIAHVYDAGNLPDSRPYFVMEHIDGQPITVHCRERSVSLDERLRLFVEVARGVEHAHQHGIVHRDLKPANVLVVSHTGEAQPKIIDFGIAKAMSGGTNGSLATATDAGRVLGTPGYMSPEQASGFADAVDARADVFALGVLLCELLADDLPWPRSGPTAAAEPVLPSQRLMARAKAAPPAQATTLRRLAVAVRGDLDWIVGKAIRPERAARYASVGAMCDDISRFLRGEPVLAGPPSLRYRLRKLMRRRRVATAVLLTAGVCTLLGAAVVTWSGQGAAAAVDSTDARQAVSALLRNARQLTTMAGPSNETARAALARDALAFFDRWLQQQPSDATLRAGRATALVELSQVHWELGQHEAALRTAVIASDEIAAIGDRAFDPRMQAQAWRHRGRALHALARNLEAVPWLERARAAIATIDSPTPTEDGRLLAAIDSELSRSHIEAWRFAEALATARRAVEVLESLALAGAAHPDVRADLALARILLGEALLATDDRAAAATTLATAEGELGAVATASWRATAMLRFQQAALAAHGDDIERRVAAFERCRAACEQWCEREPLQYRAHDLLSRCLLGLAVANERASEWLRADAAMQAAIAAAEKRAAVMLEPEPALRSLRWLRFKAVRNLWDRFRVQDLPLAREILQGIDPDDRDGFSRPIAFELRAMAMLLADAAGTSDLAAWRAVGAAMPPFHSVVAASAGNQFVEAWLGVFRAELAAGDTAGAAAAMKQVDTALADGQITDDHSTRALHGKAMLALANGEFEVGDRALEQLLAKRPTWWSRVRVGSWRVQVAQRLADGGQAELAAARYRQASGVLEDAVKVLAAKVEQAPADPFVVVPWGFAELDLAAAESALGNEQAALSRLRRVVPMLAAVRSTAHRDQWDEVRFARAEAAVASAAGGDTKR